MLCDRGFDKLQKYLDLFGKINSSKDDNMGEKFKKIKKKHVFSKLSLGKIFVFFLIIF
jgi:hypothetical protein